MCHIPAVNSCHCVKYSALVDPSVRTMASAACGHQLKYLTLSRDTWILQQEKFFYDFFSNFFCIKVTDLKCSSASHFLSFDISYWNSVTLTFKNSINWCLSGLELLEIIFVHKNDNLPQSSSFIYVALFFCCSIVLCFWHLFCVDFGLHKPWRHKSV